MTPWPEAQLAFVIRDRAGYTLEWHALPSPNTGAPVISVDLDVLRRECPGADTLHVVAVSDPCVPPPGRAITHSASRLKWRVQR